MRLSIQEACKQAGYSSIRDLQVCCIGDRGGDVDADTVATLRAWCERAGHELVTGLEGDLVPDGTGNGEQAPPAPPVPSASMPALVTGLEGDLVPDGTGNGEQAPPAPPVPSRQPAPGNGSTTDGPEGPGSSGKPASSLSFSERMAAARAAKKAAREGNP